MYNYCIQWEDGYEESSEIFLTHKTKYSNKELHDLIYSFIPDIFEKAKEEKIKDGEDYAKKFPEYAYKVKSNDYYDISPHDLHDAIVRRLVDSYGFKHAKFEAGFQICGMHWDDFDSDCNIRKALEDTGFSLEKVPSFGFGMPTWVKHENP